MDVINRQVAIDALWKALYAYEDKTERQFIESEELDVGDWMEHRIFVQNMSDIDRQTILELPSADAVEVVRCKDCTHRCFDNRFGYICSLDTGDPYEMGRDAHNENWYCADGEKKNG